MTFSTTTTRRTTTTIPRRVLSILLYTGMVIVVSVSVTISVSVSSVEAWTMMDPQPSSGKPPQQPKRQQQLQHPFPTPSTPPTEVLEAQLHALQEGDLVTTHHLFSRARRLALHESACTDMRQTIVNIPPEHIHSIVQQYLLEQEQEQEKCTSSHLIGHHHHQILSVVQDPFPEQGRLRKLVCRVGIWSNNKKDNNDEGSNNSSRSRSRSRSRRQQQRRYHYLITLTRQSSYDGGDPRDQDGFENCWLVWSIQREDEGRRQGSSKKEREGDDGTPNSPSSPGQEKVLHYL